MIDDPQATALLRKLGETIRPRGSVLTAYSGGVDSTVVAVAARQVLGADAAPAAIGVSPSLPQSELDEARGIAAQFDLRLVEVHPQEQDDPRYRANDADRCFFCKSHLYDSLRQIAAQRNIAWIANGANVDDLGDHRPGMEAGKQASIISPLIDAGMGKTQVRQIAQALGLPNWDKPAAACLASRIPFGTPVTIERLSQVERAEAFMRELGFSGFRVRHHESVARLEIPADQMTLAMTDATRGRIVAGLKALGYRFVALDLEGFRSGSGNVLVGKPPRP